MKGGNTEITNAKEYHKLDMFHLQLMSKMMEQVQLLDQLLHQSVSIGWQLILTQIQMNSKEASWVVGTNKPV